MNFFHVAIVALLALQAASAPLPLDSDGTLISINSTLKQNQVELMMAIQADPGSHDLVLPEALSAGKGAHTLHLDTKV